MPFLAKKQLFFSAFWAAAALFFQIEKTKAQTHNSLKINVLENERGAVSPYFSKNRSAESAWRAAPDGSFERSADDSLGARNLLEEALAELRAEGHLTASFDTVLKEKTGWAASLRLGPKFHWAELRLDSSARRAIEQAGLERAFQNARKRPAEILHFENRLLQNLENQGFAFARVGLSDFEIDSSGEGLRASLQVWQGPLIVFSGIRTEGDAHVSTGYLSQFLGIRAGEPYNRERVMAVRKNLQASPVAELAGNPVVTFRGSTATVNLLLKKKRGSRFDFLLGLLPRPASQSGPPLLTGQATAEILNAFGQGERLFVDLQRLRPETQRLDLEGGWPFALGLPIGATARFHLFKRDTSYLETASELGGQFFFDARSHVKFFWERRASNLLKINALSVRSSRRLPENLDARSNSFGLETVVSRLDHRFNPRRGWSLRAKAGAGFRKTPRNAELLAIGHEIQAKFENQYDSLGARAAFGRGDFLIERFFPLSKTSALRLAASGGGIFSKKAVLQNEQFRIGGARTMRGYDQESIFATRFLVSTAELRLLLGENSFMSVFSDVGYVEDLTARKRVFLRPLGLGAGMNLETKAGILAIALAVGRPEGSGLDFRAAKIHIGFVSLF